MTAPEREALVKALRDASDGWSGDAACVSAEIAARAADMIEALSAPAVTVTEDARNGDYSDDISPEAFETLRKSVEGVNSSRLDRAVETLNNYTISDRFPRSERDAVIAAVENLIDNSPIDDKDRPYISEVAFREFNALVAAFDALKSTTPQTGSRE